MVTWRHERVGRIDRLQRDDRLADERRWVHRLIVAARERAPAHQTRLERLTRGGEGHRLPGSGGGAIEVHGIYPPYPRP